MLAPPQSRTRMRQPLQKQWLTLGDGLQVQRVHLHLSEWSEVINSKASLPDVPDLGVVVGLASYETMTVVSPIVDGAGLRPWVTLPSRHGFPFGPANILAPAAIAQSRAVVGEGVGRAVAADLSMVCEAAAWWVGFFAVIRHRGVHHLSLQPELKPINRALIEEATGVVALGLVIRVLQEHLRAVDAADASLRLAYCRALTASITVERRMPELLDELEELRLVDLVSMAVPWRGRFIKYSGGTGAGQVE